MEKKGRIVKTAIPGWVRPALLIGIPLFAAALTFMSRSPVLVVSDLVFDSIYGETRIRIKQAEASLRLWRRVKNVRIADDAGEDVAVFAVGAAAKKPFCVLFPYRYYNEAKRYAGEFPAVPVGVLQGRFRDLSGLGPDDGGEENLFFIRTDSALDFYRAGQCAAVFAQAVAQVSPELPGEQLVSTQLPPEAGGEGGEGSPPLAGHEPGEIFFLYDELVSDGDREAFNQGVADRGYERTPVYQNAGAAFTPRPNMACVVISAPSQSFFEQSLDIPVLLFSWIDPALTPSRIKLVFDDSPWVLAVPAVKTAGRQGDIPDIIDIPSEIQVLRRRINGKERLGNIKQAIRSHRP
jgi:hypothetical protein